jgi:hypothetical protein
MIIAHDLRRLPLIHGSLFLNDFWDQVQSGGIRVSPNAKRVSTTEWDVALGRHKFVYLQPAAVHRTYGMGDIIIIHPAVLDTPGVHGLVNDPGSPGGLLQQLEVSLVFGPESFEHSVGQYIRDSELAEAMIKAASRVNASNSGDWHRARQAELLRQDLLPSLYQKRCLRPFDFYKTLASDCNRRGFTIADYLNRTIHTWPFSEELCVPEKIDPEHIIGRWRGKTLLALRKPQGEVRLAEFMSFWQATH